MQLHNLLERLLFKPKPDAFSLQPAGRLEGREINKVCAGSATEAMEAVQKHHIRNNIPLPDLFLHLADDPVPLALSSLTTCGLWSVKAPAHAGHRFDMTCVWEVLHHRDVCKTAVYAYFQKPAPVRLVYRSWHSTSRNSIRWNQHHARWKARTAIPRLLDELNRLGREAFFQRHDYGGDKKAEHAGMDDSVPAISVLMKSLLTRFWRFCKGRIRGRFCGQQWVLLTGKTEKGERGFSLADYRIHTHPGNALQADPFIIREKKHHWVFFEAVPGKGKGVIAAMPLDEQGRPGRARTVLERPYHLSYPFLFEADSRLYMLPESSANRRIELYACRSFPDKWELAEVIMDGVEAADSSLVRHDGIFWLFTSLRPHPGVSINDELYLFFSDKLIGGQWQSHPANPVVSDVRNARMGGRFFIDRGRLFRPAQDASKHYGYAVSIMEVTRLSKTCYAERLFNRIEPQMDQRLKGMHTFNFAGTVAVSDALMPKRKWC